MSSPFLFPFFCLLCLLASNPVLSSGDHRSTSIWSLRSLLTIIVDRASEDDVRSPYTNTANIVNKTAPEPKYRQEILSIFLKDENFTETLNKKLQNCSARATETDETNWGLFEAKRFTPDILQAEYFVNVADHKSGDFALTFFRYLESGGLAECIGISKDHISEAKTADEADDVKFSSTSSKLKSWVVPIILGVVGFATIVALAVLMSINARKSFPEEKYEQDPNENAEMEPMAVSVDLDETRR